MNKAITILLSVLTSIAAPGFVLAEPLGAQVSTQAVTASVRLADVHSIYVAPLGAGEETELVRQKVINRLLKSGIVSVSEIPEEADAILVGASTVSSKHCFDASFSKGFGSASGYTRYAANSVVRLVNHKKQILWAGEASSRRIFYGGRSVNSATSNVADKTVNSLTKAIEAARLQLATVGVASQ